MKSGFSIIIIFLALALAGCLLIPRLPVKLFPTRELPSLSVDFSMPGSSSRIVEQEVTSRVEGALARIEGVRKVSSRSRNGSGSVSLELDKHADLDVARLEASAVIRQLWGSFPQEVSYPFISISQANNKAKSAFMTYTVSSAMNSMEINAYVDEKVKPVISDIPGVDAVSIYGVTPNEWRLEYDADKLAVAGLTPEDISSAIKRNYGVYFLGLVDTERGWIRLVRKSPGKADVFNPKEILVTPKNGSPIPLDRLVRAIHTEGTPTSHFRINGLTSIYLNVYATDGANQLEVGTKVAEAMASISSSAPADMRFLLSNDATDTIREELEKIYFRTGLTVLILLVFIVLLTRDIRYTLLVVTGLTVNMAVAVIFYYALGTEIQLYSLAGITISLNLIIDNIIVMCDHYKRHHDRRVFPAILAATLTTAGALVVVFLMDDEVKLNLMDFVVVVVVNLLVSLLVALLLVPALADRMRIRVSRKGRGFVRRFNLCLNKIYRCYIRIGLRWRWTLLLLMLGGMGWSGYLFFSRVREGSYSSRNQDERMLYVNASLPNGSTLSQMDVLMRRMETFLAEYNEIKQFQTNVYNGRRGQISIKFKKSVAKGGFPYRLKAEIVSKALTLGGGSWSVYGLEDNGFLNDVRESAGSMRVKMSGFNYDELSRLAGIFRDSLLNHRRIREVEIKTDFSYRKDDYEEFTLIADREALAKENLTVSDFYEALSQVFGRDIDCGSVSTSSYIEPIKMSSSQSQGYDVWGLLNMPVSIRGKVFKLQDLATFTKSNVPQDVVKENQSYRLCMQYDYIGSYEQGKKMLDREIEKYSKTLPAGYSIEKDDYGWGAETKDYNRYGVLGIIALIIFFLSAVLFNSILRPLAIIVVIPMSYVGIFLTFKMFGLKFDQGGFASFILLSGITVNAAIYIINEFDGIRKRYALAHGESSIADANLSRRFYMQAFRVKIMPVIMTVFSTVLGFIPFIVGTERESFWFALAAGTIGGLVFSIVVIVGYLPLLVLRKEKRRRRKKRKRFRLFRNG